MHVRLSADNPEIAVFPEFCIQEDNISRENGRIFPLNIALYVREE